MKCLTCNKKMHKYGKSGSGKQKYRCPLCGSNFTDKDIRSMNPDTKSERYCIACDEYKPKDHFYKNINKYHQSKCKECMVIEKRISTYNLTPEDFKEILQSQNNTCAICKKAFTATPHIDHDHRSGDVRGLLCRSCNIGIGHFEDDTERLKNAISYLESV